MRASRGGLLVACLSVATACTTPAPPRVVKSATGTVRAASLDQAWRVAGLLDELRTEMHHEVPGLRQGELEVWVQDELSRYRYAPKDESVRAFTLDTRGHAPGRIHIRGNEIDSVWTLGHELVHSLLDESWDELPAALEEGLCDVVVERIAPAFGPRIRGIRILNAAPYFGGTLLHLFYEPPRFSLEVADAGARVDSIRCHRAEPDLLPDLATMLGWSRGEFDAEGDSLPGWAYGAGYLVCRRIVDRWGVGGLRDLCRFAREADHDTIPSRWILDAAGLDPRIERPLGEHPEFRREELEALLAATPGFFASAIAAAFRPSYGFLSSDAFLQDVEPHLWTRDGGFLPLAPRPEFRASLRELWPAPGPELATR